MRFKKGATVKTPMGTGKFAKQHPDGTIDVIIDGVHCNFQLCDIKY